MTIYAVRNDGFTFQELDLEVDDFIDQFPADIDYHSAHDFSVKNFAFKPWWKPLTTGFTAVDGEESSPTPDISTWIGATLVLSPRAHRLLGDLLEAHGELLPLQIGDETFHIFNCLNLADIDDEASSRGKAVFKSKSQGCLDVFCGDQFKDAVETYKLRGVVFDTNLSSPFAKG